MTDLRTKKGRAKFTSDCVLSNKVKIYHIVNCLGLKHKQQHGNFTFETHRAHRLQNRLLKECRDFDPETEDDEFTSYDADFRPALEKLVDDETLLTISLKVAEEYGPLLWGDKPRDHLFRGGDINEYPQDLYWNNDDSTLR